MKFWNVLKNNSVTEHLIVLMNNLYTDQETTFIRKIGNTDWSQTEKVKAAYSPYLFNPYPEHDERRKAGEG